MPDGTTTAYAGGMRFAAERTACCSTARFNTWSLSGMLHTHSHASDSHTRRGRRSGRAAAAVSSVMPMGEDFVQDQH
jgi:hypothetical protein